MAARSASVTLRERDGRMTRRILTAALLALALAVTPAAAARSGEPPRQQKLSNGLTLILAPDARAGGVDVTVWYRAGTRWETAGRTGLTHLIEQLMFRSTPPAGQDGYIQRVRRMGGTVGTESTPDYSSFFQTVPPEALEEVFALEADRMTELRITPATFTEVRRLVMQNRERTGRTPVARGMQQLYADAFADHPYAWPAIGLAADAGAVTLEDCLAWHRARYGPGNAIVTVTGRFKPADAAAAAKRTLGRVPRRDPPRADAPVPAGGGTRTVGTYVFSGPSIALGWVVTGAAAEEMRTLELLARYLSGDAAAPLRAALIGRGRPTGYVQCGFEARREAGMFFALAALQSGADSAAVGGVEAVLVDEIRRIASEGVDEERLQRASRALQVERLFSLQRPRDRAAALGRALLVEDRDLRSFDPAGTLFDAGADAVKRAAARWLAARPTATVWMMPAGDEMRGEGR